MLAVLVPLLLTLAASIRGELNHVRSEIGHVAATLPRCEGTYMT